MPDAWDMCTADGRVRWARLDGWVVSLLHLGAGWRLRYALIARLLLAGWKFASARDLADQYGLVRPRAHGDGE